MVFLIKILNYIISSNKHFKYCYTDKKGPSDIERCEGNMQYLDEWFTHSTCNKSSACPTVSKVSLLHGFIKMIAVVGDVCINAMHDDNHLCSGAKLAYFHWRGGC